LTAAEERAQLTRLAPTLLPVGFGACQLVVEAIVEELAAKRALLAVIAAELGDDAVLASNTSTLPIARLAAGLPAPERVLGLHFFSPVAKMPLVEIVRHDGTCDAAVERARRFVATLGKIPIVVGDGPGFYTSRILAPYLAEGVRLLAAGMTVPAVDAAGRAAGFPVGPLTLVDEIGLDVACRAAATLAAAFPERMPAAAAFDRLVASGRLGRKSGRGFYVYRGPVKRSDPEVVATLGLAAEARPVAAEEAADRLRFAMAAEAVRCLEAGIVSSPRDGDLGAVLGLGFPPDLGGPFRWLDQLGPGQAVGRLEGLRAATGAAIFDPPPLLRAHAERGTRFHSGGSS
jgi:3-hydroxyacyl-CoA dehydrogenase/enoyl-CoA hydratase/3-hydroxybutyryl-CoA epimerase